ncbi:MAG: hypothetical protein RIF32_15170 [Leptospirales bacterium]
MTRNPLRYCKAPRRASVVLGLLALIVAVSGTQCLALSDDCGAKATDCELQPLLVAYLTIEAYSFRPPPCGTFGPARQIEENDGLLSSLAFVGPVSIAGSLAYDAGFVNRPLHLVGCTPALVSASISVNAAPAVLITEGYIYNSVRLSTRRLLTTNAGSFTIDVAYGLNDYPETIMGDCQVGASGRSLIQHAYDILSRPIAFAQTRPMNSDTANPNSRVITSSASYPGVDRGASLLITKFVEASATNTTTTDIVSTASYIRDGNGRLTRRDQTDQIALVTTNPATSSNQTRTFTFTYTHDELGRMTQFSGDRGPNTNAVIDYTYDAADRVIGMSSTGMASGVAANSTDSFTYGANGDILTHLSNFTIGATTTVASFTFSN